ncbi:MAG: hypothetical protein EBR82_08155 [Caulobacteraceae bacterium]|nr:hypothetical protein [Caulobacteraceae bacterium]
MGRQTPAAEWRRLTPTQQRALDVMGEAEPIALPWHVLRPLLQRDLAEPRRSGHILTPFGVEVRDFGRRGR